LYAAMQRVRISIAAYKAAPTARSTAQKSAVGMAQDFPPAASIESREGAKKRKASRLRVNIICVVQRPRKT
ncbi:MAG: hypothetical protein ACREF9_18570, partial [Opitutaceae bacterium]